jgi:hypothetical protein
MCFINEYYIIYGNIIGLFNRHIDHNVIIGDVVLLVYYHCLLEECLILSKCECLRL